MGFGLGLVPAFISLLLLRQLRRRLRRRHAQLTAANRRNQSIVEGSGEGVLELDNVGHVRYANPAAAKMLGYETEELPGSTIACSSTRRKTAIRGPIRCAACATRPTSCAASARCCVGRTAQFRPVEYKIVPVTEEGASVGTVLVFRDIGERVRLDNLLKDMQATAQDRRLGIRRRPANNCIGPKRCTRSTTCRSASRSSSNRSRAFFHPEDRKKLQAAERMALDTGCHRTCSCE